MKKRVLLIGLFFGIFLINLVSAQFVGWYGGYFDEQMIVYGLIFIVLFALINFALGRTIFKTNRGTCAIASLALAGLVIYGLNKTNFNVGGIHAGGIYIEDYAPAIFTILLVGVLIWSIYRRVFPNVLMGIGAFLIIISFTDLVYEKNIILILGIILLILGLLLRFRFTGRWDVRGPRGWRRGAHQPHSPQQRIIYRQRQRSISEMQQKLNHYKFIINNPRTSVSSRRRLLRVMYRLERGLRRLGAAVPGQPVRNIEAGLRARRMI